MFPSPKVFLALYNNRKGCDYMVYGHYCQHNQYGPHGQSGEHKIIRLPCKSIFNMVFMHISFLSFSEKKKKEERKKKKQKRKKKKK